MERLTTEKQALGFFGALCGVMVSQLPQLRTEHGLDLVSAISVVGCLIGLVLSATYLRRSMGKRLDVLVCLAAVVFLACGSSLMWPEMGIMLEHGYKNLTALQISYLNLKIVILTYLGCWSAISFIDTKEAAA